MSRLAELRLAVMMLTRLPAGRLVDPAPSLAQAAWAFPLIGLLVGVLAWAVFAGALALDLTVTIAALLCLTAGALITGALHHDGLADYADGIGGGRDRAHCLEIMRDSRIGSYGVLALILAVALMASGLAAHPPGLATFLVIAVGSRLAMLVLLVLLPPARGDGLGQKAGHITGLSLLPGVALLCILAVFLGSAALWLILAMGLAAWAIGALADRRIGGQTGDVLGAAQLTAATLAWALWPALAAA